MNKKLLFCLFVFLFSGLLPFSWLEHPVASCMKYFLLLTTKGNNFVDYYMEQVKKNQYRENQGYQTQYQQEVFQEKFNKSILESATPGIEIFGQNRALKTFFDIQWYILHKEDIISRYSQYSHRVMYKIGQYFDLSDIESKMGSSASIFRGKLEEYTDELTHNANIKYYTNEEQKLIRNAVDFFNDFKKNPNFEGIEKLIKIYESIQFANEMTPYEFDKKLRDFVSTSINYLSANIIYQYMPFYQFNQF